MTEEILEEDGKGNTNTIKIGDWNSVVRDKAHPTLFGLWTKKEKPEIANAH
jgi:hypothetical protein